MDKDLLLIACAIVRRQGSKKGFWLLIKEEDSDEWEFPKMVARKGESSVRAGIRMMEEQASMDARVIEEAGRAGGMITINGKTVSKRTLYYAMIQREGGEILGFAEHGWFDYATTVRKLSSKRERAMVKNARKEIAKFYKDEKDNPATKVALE